MSLFKFIPCGETLPQNNIHAVSVSMPTLQDVIDYEEKNPAISQKIKVAYPRFVMHPYLKLLAKYIEQKYNIDNSYEVVLLSSTKAVNVVKQEYQIENSFKFDESFGIILVKKETDQLQKVLKFIQHSGYNLSSRFAQDYLIKVNILDKAQDELLEDESKSKEIIISTLAQAYNQPKESIALTTSGINAVFALLTGLKKLQSQNNRAIIIQLGWLYLDTMNIIEHYFQESKTFYDVNNLDLLQEYLRENGFKVSAIITEIPTNPLLQSVDLDKLKALCNKYDIPLVIDSTFATPFNLNLNPYADIFVESLTKFACGNADVLMGAIILNSDSKLFLDSKELFQNCDEPYIKDIQRLAIEIKNYKNRMEIIGKNSKKLIEYLKTAPFIDEIFYCLSPKYEPNYKKLMLNEESYTGVVSVTFNKNFEDVYNRLNFPKGPSLGSEFTLLMPYTYLAHYDLVTTEDGQKLLNEIGLPINLLRISVGVENIDEIIAEFKRIEEF